MSTDLRRPISPSGGLAPPVLGYASTRCAPSGPRRQTSSWGTWTPNTSPPFGITHLALSQSSPQLRIAVDGMGGDHAPEQVVLGASQAAEEFGLDVVVVGLPD